MTTLLLSLGGSAYPHAAALRHDAFGRSSRAVASLLTSGPQPLVAPGNHLDLLDDARAWPEQLMAIRAWLRLMIGGTLRDAKGARVENVLVHYVGHGMLKASSQEHYLTINATDADERAMTSASLRELNEILSKHAPGQRRIYLVDACFAAASMRDLMSAAEDALEVQVGGILTPWPESGQGDRGVAALCSADRDSTASAGGRRSLTQFTDGLLTVMEAGDGGPASRMSLRRLHELLRSDLLRRYGDEAVRPVLVTLEDGDGGIAAVPLFPNGTARAGTGDKGDCSSNGASAETGWSSPAGGPDPMAGAAAGHGPDGSSKASAWPTDGPTPDEGRAAASGIAGGNATNLANVASNMEEGMSPEQRFRQAAYRFFRLPHSDKEAITRRLGVGPQPAGQSDLDRYKAALATARESDRLDRLEGMIVKAEGK